MSRHQNSHVPATKGRGELTRRSLLQRAAWVFAARAIPGAAKLAAQDIGPTMTKLSAYMSEARTRELPDKVMNDAKHHVLDTLAAMVSGSELPPGRQAIRFAGASGGKGLATVVGSQILCAPMDAAFANGELAQSDESDDDYSGGGAHPGCAIVPAALALGEQIGIGGMHFLRAVTLGYDLGMRAMQTVGTGLKDTHPLVGTMGAAGGGGWVAGFYDHT